MKFEGYNSACRHLACENGDKKLNLLFTIGTVWYRMLLYLPRCYESSKNVYVKVGTVFGMTDFLSDTEMIAVL